MRLKKGVIATRIQPELLLALTIADSVWEQFGCELVVTSLNDGKHSQSSLHYAGQAADLRTHCFPAEKVPAVADMLKEALGQNPDFDVVVEKDHIHIEWQPKYRGA